MTDPAFDVAAAHKFFSANCFNEAWEFIQKRDRTRDDDEQMLLAASASMWHWTQRPDCTPTKKAIGWWQLSRINAILGRANESRRFAQLSLEHSSDEEPFFVGYAYEALARAEFVANNRAKSQEYLAEAERRAELVTDIEDRESLVSDLRSLRAEINGRT